tara:strand:+ start:329 stop:718 length:390 start_codon:yes stop_codon:yes gene_type:complete
MKLTKARLKQIIKEEIEGTQGHAFVIYRPGHYRSDPSTTIAYVDNVPMSMIDTENYVRFKSTHTDPERFLKISEEGMQTLGYGTSVDSRRIDKVPERIEVTVPYNPRTGELMLDNSLDPLPEVIDASGM